jgi:RimJ/RimL family protein N-acetyltransferase
LGWYLRSGCWRRGYATEATRLLLDFGFFELQRATLWATADPENLASLRVLEKCGLTNRGLTDPGQTWRGVRSRVLFTIEAEQWSIRSDHLGPASAPNAG